MGLSVPLDTNIVCNLTDDVPSPAKRAQRGK